MPLTYARALYLCDLVVEELNAIQPDTDLEYEAVRQYSFGFADGDLSDLQVPVRPYDMTRETESRDDEEHNHQIEIGIYKKVDRKDVESIDAYFNVAITFANLFPIDRVLSVDSSNMTVVENRFFPLFTRSEKIMDNYNSAETRFISHILLTFKEWVST